MKNIVIVAIIAAVAYLLFKPKTAAAVPVEGKEPEKTFFADLLSGVYEGTKIVNPFYTSDPVVDSASTEPVVISSYTSRETSTTPTTTTTTVITKPTRIVAPLFSSNIKTPLTPFK